MYYCCCCLPFLTWFCRLVPFLDMHKWLVDPRVLSTMMSLGTDQLPPIGTTFAAPCYTLARNKVRVVPFSWVCQLGQYSCWFASFSPSRQHSRLPCFGEWPIGVPIYQHGCCILVLGGPCLRWSCKAASQGWTKSKPAWGTWASSNSFNWVREKIMRSKDYGYTSLTA